VDEIAAALDDLVSHTGIDVPIPVDAASGVFAASDPRPALKAGLNR
jgi:glutamate/tyrosine decarboxylase-like PLP-dependent enzyme